MTFPVRRTALAALALGGAFASCSVTHVNEVQVRTIAADQMDCEEQLLKLEGLDGPASGVARYRIVGCGRRTTLDCIEEREEVRCRHAGHGGGSDGDDDGTGEAVGEAVVGAAAGCACGSLFGRSSDKDPLPSSSPSPMSTTPQRTKR